MQCLTPIYLKDKNIYVPCGKCNICRYNYYSKWLARLNMESDFSNLVLFTTLTFNDDNYPIDLSKENQKSIIQKFLKRFRAACNSFDYHFKYFLVSEFGKLHDRLHFHILFFFKYSDTTNYNSAIINIDNIINKCWRFGFTSSILSNVKVISYMLKYEIKDISKNDTIRLISKNISLDFANCITQDDLYKYNYFSSSTRNYRPNRYILDKVFPHSKQQYESGKLSLIDIENWENFKFSKGISDSPINREKLYSSLCKIYLPNCKYDSFNDIFIYNSYDSTDIFIKFARFEPDLGLYLSPDIVISYINNHINLFKNSKL